MGRLYKEYIDSNGEPHYVCKRCETDLVLAADLVSDEYRSGAHKAMLFENVVNLDLGEQHERQMTSGMHTIRNIYCLDCRTELGWKYIGAHDSLNKHKEGKFILVAPFIVKRERASTIPMPPHARQTSDVSMASSAAGSAATPHLGRRRAVDLGRDPSLSGGSDAGISDAIDFDSDEEEDDSHLAPSVRARRASLAAREAEQEGSIWTHLRLVRRALAESQARIASSAQTQSQTSANIASSADAAQRRSLRSPPPPPAQLPPAALPPPPAASGSAPDPAATAPAQAVAPSTHMPSSHVTVVFFDQPR